MKQLPVSMLEEVAALLGALADEVVFVGGASLCFYIQDSRQEQPRFTDDVDCVLAATTLLQFHKFEKRLREAGFSPCQEQGSSLCISKSTSGGRPAGQPICRWIVGPHRVDFMPQEAAALGFSNRWYSAGYKNPMTVTLPSGLNIKIFSLGYFLAAKLEAHLDRGGSDIRLSQDLEDVVSVLGSRTDLETLSASIPEDVRGYLSLQFKALLENPGFDEALSATLETTRPAPKAKARVVKFLHAVINSSG